MTNEPIAFQFTEDMTGFVSFEQTAFEDGYDFGKVDGTTLGFHLTIRTPDLDYFLENATHEASAVGYIDCPKLGGKLLVIDGRFNLFVETGDDDRRKMTYRLHFLSGEGQAMTLSGEKRVQDNVGFDVWSDTTTLYVNLYEGLVDEENESGAVIVASGILHLHLTDFLAELASFRAYAPSFRERLAAVERFGRFFLGTLWEVYGRPTPPTMDLYEREIPLYTTEGVSDAKITTHAFSTADKLGLSLLRFHRADCDDIILIIHGLTTSSDMFIMPEHYNLVQFLLDNGFSDVWTVDYRMSNRFSYNLQRNRFNMDDIALFDFPKAVAEMRKFIGPTKRIHVICHCLGSVAFTMSLFAKITTGISSVIANSVALTPRVPRWSKIKLALGPMLCEYVAGVEYVNPYWRRQPGLSPGKLLGLTVSAFHRECHVPECHMLSFMWGTGSPALYSHENLLDVTHRRGGDLYGGVSVHYYRHVRKMVNAGSTAVKYEENNPKYSALPNNYFERIGEIQTPVLFVTGQNNHVFVDSNIECHKRINELVPGRHELHVFPNYGHQDVFMGKNCHRDIFPVFLEFLSRHRLNSGLRSS